MSADSARSGDASAVTPDDIPCCTPSTELMAAIRRRGLSPVELCTALRSRIECLQSQLKCFGTVIPEQARKATKVAEGHGEGSGGDPCSSGRYAEASRLPHPGPLGGPAEINGVPTRWPAIENQRLNDAITHVGCPAITVLARFPRTGLPTGLQPAAPAWQCYRQRWHSTPTRAGSALGPF